MPGMASTVPFLFSRAFVDGEKWDVQVWELESQERTVAGRRKHATSGGKFRYYIYKEEGL